MADNDKDKGTAQSAPQPTGMPPTPERLTSTGAPVDPRFEKTPAKEPHNEAASDQAKEGGEGRKGDGDDEGGEGEDEDSEKKPVSRASTRKPSGGGKKRTTKQSGKRKRR